MGVESTPSSTYQAFKKPNRFKFKRLFDMIFKWWCLERFKCCNNVNINVNYVNDVYGASNLNTVSYEEKLLINQFPNIKYPENVRLIRYIFSLSLKNWEQCCLCLCFCLYLCCLCFFGCLRSQEDFVFNVRKNLGSNID